MLRPLTTPSTTFSVPFSRTLALLCSLVLLTLAPTITPALAQVSLQTDLERLARSGRLSLCKIGFAVQDAQSGAFLATYNADESFIPASNMKLFTAGAALHILSPDFTFQSYLYHDQETGVLRFVGSGDPAMGDPKLLEMDNMTPEQFVASIAQAAEQGGVTNVSQLIIDDRVLDRDWVHPSWPVEQLNRWYCAEVGGINFHTNVLYVYATPSTSGRPGILNLQPRAEWINITNSTTTSRRSRHSAWASRRYMTNTITMHGEVFNAAAPVYVTFNNPPLFFGQMLSGALSDVGLAPEQGFRLVDAEERLPEGQPVAVIKTPLDVVLERINTDSQNMYAEAVFKRLGHEIANNPGSWSNGGAAVRMVIAETLGATASKAISVADGSGMSRQNKTSPRALAEWLRAIHSDDRIADTFVASLAAPRTGTLRNRFRDIRTDSFIRAKSGRLSGVSALSGYVTHPESGETLIFSVLVNDQPSSVPLSDITEFQELLVAELDKKLVFNFNQRKLQEAHEAVKP